MIDSILATDVTAPPKQSHTAKRNYERLRAEHGFLGGYKTVKDYLRLARRSPKMVGARSHGAKARMKIAPPVSLLSEFDLNRANLVIRKDRARVLV